LWSPLPLCSSHTHAHMHPQARTRMHAHVHRHASAHTRANMHTHTHTHTRTHTHTHTHTHTQTHTHIGKIHIHTLTRANILKRYTGKHTGVDACASFERACRLKQHLHGHTCKHNTDFRLRPRKQRASPPSAIKITALLDWGDKVGVR